MPEEMPLTAAMERDQRVHTPDIDPRALRYAVRSFTEICGDLDVLSIQRRHVSDWLGHASRDESDIYGARTGRLIELADALKAAMSHLGKVDDGEYEETERLEHSSEAR